MRFRGTARLYLILACMCLPPSAPSAELQWAKAAGPEGGDIRGLSASGDTAVAATAQGDYYRSNDGGRTWSLLYRNPVPEASIPGYASSGRWVPDPFFFGDRILGAAAVGGALCFQGGRTTLFQADLPNGLTRFRPSGFLRHGERIYALSDAIFASADSARTWFLVTDMLGGIGPITAMAEDANFLYAMNAGSELYAASKQDTSWSLVRRDLFRDSLFAGMAGVQDGLLIWWRSGEILKMSWRGDVFKDGSATLPGRGPWTVRYAGGKLFASGSQGISQSPDSGFTWVPLTGAPSEPIQAMAGLPGGDFLAGTENGLYRWDHLAGQWKPSQTGLKAVEKRQSGHGWPRVLRARSGSEPAGLAFTLADRAGLYAIPFAADGRRLAPGLRKHFETGRHQWMLPALAGVAYWAIGMERPFSAGME